MMELGSSCLQDSKLRKWIHLPLPPVWNFNPFIVQFHVPGLPLVTTQCHVHGTALLLLNFKLYGNMADSPTSPYPPTRQGQCPLPLAMRSVTNELLWWMHFGRHTLPSPMTVVNLCCPPNINASFSKHLKMPLSIWAPWGQNFRIWVMKMSLWRN